MSKSITAPRLNLGNQIYLYRLLRDALGCGKQTFITQVEEALANADMAAYDLGFDDTRALLEAMGDCVKLTVFKGGRVYATVIANEAWDAALEKADQPKQKETGKKLNPRKKKKGDKALKPIKPKHVKRPEPEPEAAAEAVVDAASDGQTATAASEAPAENQAEADSKLQSTAAAEPSSEVEQEPAPSAEPQPRNGEVFSLEEEVEIVEETVVEVAVEDPNAPEPAAAPAPAEPEPAISLTVIYDPENANAGIQTWESKPVSEQAHEAAAETEAAADTALDNEAKGEETKSESTEDVAEYAAEPTAENGPASPVTVEPETKPEPEVEPEPEAKPESEAVQEAPTPAPLPTIPEDYPTDFATEVFCPGPLLHEISLLLPYGADAMGIVGEYYWIARERGTIQASRNRATFALRYTQDGERHEAIIRIRRNTSGGMGAPWSIDKVETK